jgi:hypothetical protein
MTVIQILVRDLRSILANHLTPGPRLRDRITLAILLLFSTSSQRAEYYRWNLLFRDFSAAEPDQVIPLPNGSTVTLPLEALRYFDDVLWLRRLTLANNLKERPSNMHLLLERLCQLNAEGSRWSGTRIQRRLSQTPREEPFFAPLAKSLASHCARLGQAYGDISARRREEFGPFWLQTAGSAAEVAEELSLDNVIEACPLPLQSGFSDDPEFAKRLLRVVEALNERYMRLRACGLKPEHWLAADKPSLAQLDELRALRLQAARYEQAGDEKETAFQKAFVHCLTEAGGKKLGGFARFEDWAEDPIGLDMLRRGVVASLDMGRDIVYPEIEDSEALPGYSDLAFGEDDRLVTEHDEDSDVAIALDEMPGEDLEDRLVLQDTFRRLPELFPEAFSPLMRQFFQAVLSHAWEPEAKRAALTDPGFRGWVEQDPRYCQLPDEELWQRLWEDAETLIRQNLNRWRDYL